MSEREGNLVRKVALTAAAFAAASAVGVGAAGAASAAESSQANLSEVAATSDQNSALGAVLNRVTTDDDIFRPAGTFNR
ncbi:hypothetical protein ACIBI9_56195 [Nonomuraea sp. NPDC050451]|uniref:hypothetical protein n=1 Tax=Nonomuraea sp. NPDC050451 TaxID=3364364 RepID=UPI00378818EC